MRGFKLISVAAAILTVALVTPSLQAQGFSSVLEKLDKLEARLNQIESSQKQDVQQLKSELANMPKNAGDPQGDKIVKEMSAKINQLEQQVTEVKAGSDEMAKSNDQLMGELLDLTYQLRMIVNDAKGGQPVQVASNQSNEVKPQAASGSPQIVSSPVGEEPSLETKFYGYVKLDGSYDQNLTSHGNFAMWVKPHSYEGDDQQFNMTANQSRLGVKISSKNYGKVELYGQFEVDLYGSVTGGTIAENKGMFMLRHAFFSVKSGNTKLLAGQTWDLFSPLNAPTLNYPVLWGAGNVGYRRAQVSLFESFAVGPQTQATLSGGVFRTIGSDLTPTFSWSLADSNETADGIDDGTDAGIPTVQGRLDINQKFSSGAKLLLGVSGLWGQLKAETNLGHSNTYETWGVCGSASLSFKSGAGLAGEYYVGSNLGSYMGGILNNSTIDGTGAAGGWAAAWFKLNPKTKMAFGGGLDTAKEEDIASGSRKNNQSIFGNITYTIVKNASVGFELSQWQTEYKDSDTMKNLRAQTSFMMNF